MAPLLSFKRTFDTSIDIGDLKIPIHVARLDKSQLEELDEGWTRWVVMPRGSTTPPDESSPLSEKVAFLNAENERFKEWNEATEKDRYEFFTSMLTRYVTVDDGLIEDAGVSVTDGQGLLRIFHGRRDVLRDLVDAVRLQNHLTDLMRKNSNSLRASASGSEVSAPTRSGERQEPTAGNAERSDSATSAAATASPDASATDVDGAPEELIKVH